MQRHAVPTKLRLNSILLGGLGIGHCAPVVLRVSLGLIKTLVSVADVTKPTAAKWATKSAKCRLFFFFFFWPIDPLFSCLLRPHEIDAAYSINKTSWDLYVWRRFKKNHEDNAEECSASRAAFDWCSVRPPGGGRRIVSPWLVACLGRLHSITSVNTGMLPCCLALYCRQRGQALAWVMT